MTDGADLDRLAELVGFEPYYHDIWGNRREIGPATKRDLIQAMGFPAGTAEEAADSLYRLRERQWRRMLTPVFVLGDGDSPGDRLTVPAQTDPAGITWTLSEEEGDVHWGEQPLSELPPTDEAVFDDVRYTRHKLALPTSLSHGYHRLAIQLNVGGGVVHEGGATLILAPNRCLTPDEMVEGGGQTWASASSSTLCAPPATGASATIPTLAPSLNRLPGWGRRLGLNPLHAMFPADPNHNSPYSPGNRGFLNTLYIDVAACRNLSIARRPANSSPATISSSGSARFVKLTWSITPPSPT